MSRLEIPMPNRAQVVVEQLYKDLERRIEASPSGLCPIDMSKAFLELCHAQTCGKCVPCRVGLRQLCLIYLIKLNLICHVVVLGTPFLSLGLMWLSLETGE